jgi:formylglycine-generating enzyme required for sulfatase activity
VYVPTGSFYLGSGGTENNHFYKYPTTTDEFEVTSEGAINTGTTNDYLWAAGYMGTDLTIPADFPKGYDAFYCMKYEITQEQYVDFLNTLTRTQQDTRTATDISGTSITNRYVMANNSAMQNRNGIRCDATLANTTDPITFYCDYNGNGTGNESGDGQNIACNFLSWADGAAYADWSGLRPMTELEYEKACRGGAAPVANEYAWGTTSIQEATGISNAGNNNESPSNSAANCIYNNNASVQGPLRVGSCTSGTRSSMGASYYGIMELSGNLWERPVTVAVSRGRAFTGSHGDGALDDGDANASNWPETDAVGSGFRGGTWFSVGIYCRASDRSFAGFSDVYRSSSFGFRCVRSVE